MPTPRLSAWPPAASSLPSERPAKPSHPVASAQPFASTQRVAAQYPFGEPRPPAELSAVRTRRPVWIALAGVFFVSTAALGFLFTSTNGKLDHATRTLVTTRTRLATEKQRVQKLNDQISTTSAELSAAREDLATTQQDEKDLESDLRTAEVCLKGLSDLGNAATSQQAFSILVRISDECKAAYKAVQNNLPG